MSVIVKSSKMIDICSCCNCCNGCSSTRQLSTNFRNSFPKKLLVAIALVVIIAMFITPSEARALERRRHRHSGSMAKTKDSGKPSTKHSLDLKRKQQRRLENLTTKDNLRPNPFKEQLTKVIRKMKNTKSFFRYEKEEDMKAYEELPPSWLPKVNFTELHYHNYNSSKDKKRSIKLKIKFKYVMPKLYKSLVEYQALFEVYQKMELAFPDTLINSYHYKRKTLLENTLKKLYSTIGEVEESMKEVNMTVRPQKTKDFSMLPPKIVNMSDCFRLDYLAFRGYGNLLNNWLSQLRCLKRSKNIAIQRHCKQWEERLREKKNIVVKRLHVKQSM